IMIVSPASLPIQPVIERAHDRADSRRISFENSRLENSRLELLEEALPVIQLTRSDRAAAGALREKAVDRNQEALTEQQKPSDQAPKTQPKADQSKPAPQQTDQQERRSFWARVFNLPPLRKRIEKALTEDWKFTDIRPRHIEWLLSDDGEDARQFFLDGINARQYRRIFKEYGCGFEDRNGKIIDDSIDTISEYGPELVKNYNILIDNRELIKRYYAGMFRDGRIGAQALIRISNSMWFSPFETQKFKMSANILHTRFQVPNHVIGPMLASVGDSFWLRRVLFRKTAPQEFLQLLNRIAPSSEGSGNAFAPALQLLVLGEEHKITFRSLDS